MATPSIYLHSNGFVHYASSLSLSVCCCAICTAAMEELTKNGNTPLVAVKITETKNEARIEKNGDDEI